MGGEQIVFRNFYCYLTFKFVAYLAAYTLCLRSAIVVL